MKRILAFLLLNLSFSFVFGQSANTFFNAGNEKLKNSDFKGAIEDYSKAISASPNFPKAYYNRANAKVRLNDFRGALEDLNKSIEQDSTSSNSYFVRGTAKSALKDYPGAIADFDKAYSIKPEPRFLANRGLVKFSMKDKDGACTDWNLVKQMGSTEADENIKKHCTAKENEKEADGAMSAEQQPEFKGGFGMALGVFAGTFGPGGNLAFQLGKKFNVRISGSYLKIEKTLEEPKFKYQINALGQTGGVGLYGEYYPFNKARGIGISAGFTYSFLLLSANASSTEGFTSDLVNFTVEQIGKIDVKLTTNTIMPYLGLCFGRSVPTRRINMRLDLGSYYMGSPKANVKATGLIRQTEGEKSQLEENLKGYVWYPYIALNINVKITK